MLPSFKYSLVPLKHHSRGLNASLKLRHKRSKEIHRQGFALGRKILLMVSQNLVFSLQEQRSRGKLRQKNHTSSQNHNKTWKLKGKRVVSAQSGGRWLQTLTRCRDTPGSSVLPVRINKSESPKHLKQLLLKEITCKGLKTWLMIKIKRGNMNTKTYSVYTKMAPALQVTGNTLCFTATQNYTKYRV